MRPSPTAKSLIDLAALITEIRQLGVVYMLKGDMAGRVANWNTVGDAALKRMVLPACIAIFAPVVIGFGFGPATLGGALICALLSGVLLALMMANSGGAWGNAKKHVGRIKMGSNVDPSVATILIWNLGI